MEVKGERPQEETLIYQYDSGILEMDEKVETRPCLPAEKKKQERL